MVKNDVSGANPRAPQNNPDNDWEEFNSYGKLSISPPNQTPSLQEGIWEEALESREKMMGKGMGESEVDVQVKKDEGGFVEGMRGHKKTTKQIHLPVDESSTWVQVFLALGWIIVTSVFLIVGIVVIGFALLILAAFLLFMWSLHESGMTMS